MEGGGASCPVRYHTHTHTHRLIHRLIQLNKEECVALGGTVKKLEQEDEEENEGFLLLPLPSLTFSNFALVWKKKIKKN